MSIIDTVLDLFKKKDIKEKIKEYADTENTGRLIRLVTQKNPTEIRMAAIDALKEIPKDELCVNTLMGLLDDEKKEIVLTALNSLKRVGTKREVDVLMHKAEMADDEELKKAFMDTAISAKERTPRF